MKGVGFVKPNVNKNYNKINQHLKGFYFKIKLVIYY